MSELEQREITSAADVTQGSATPRGQLQAASVARLALLLATIAVLAVGYTIYEDWRTQRNLLLSSDIIEDSITNLAAQIDASKQQLKGINAELEALALADSSADNSIEQLARDVDGRMRLLDALPARTANLESAINAIQGNSDATHDTWLLGEAAYYLQLANAQFQLAGNPELASLALGVADDRIAEIANPALTSIRMAIAEERAALGGMSMPDVEGITLELAAIARTVATLPMRRVERMAEPEAEELPADADSFDRAWSSIKRATSGLVKHRTSDESIMPLVSPEAEYFLRTNLALQLQTARLALMRGEQSAYAASLADASDWMRTYFDVNRESVNTALQAIASLREGMPDVTRPDISGSMQLLRRYMSVVETAQ